MPNFFRIKIVVAPLVVLELDRPTGRADISGITEWSVSIQVKGISINKTVSHCVLMYKFYGLKYCR